MPMVRCGAIDLHVVERGRGMPVVLVHGFPLDHSMWADQIDYLSKRWRIIAPDLRGFGKSQVVAGTASMEQMADDVRVLLDGLQVNEPIVLCGLSMGGYVAFQFWKKCANRLRGLVLCDTRAIADTPEGIAGRQKMIDEVLTNGTRPVADAMIPKLFAARTMTDNPSVVARQRQVIEANSPEGISAALRGLAARPDMTAQLPKISVPTLVVVGEQDAISPVEEMRGTAQAIPNAQFVVIPGAGHMTPLEDSAAFKRAIEPFLERVERGG